MSNMVVNTNIMALNSHRSLKQIGGSQSKSAEKLSSGLRINRAADDAAGLAISEKMRSQIRGLNKSSANAQDAISLIQTAEGALQETEDMLQRMRELVDQAANDTLTSSDRDKIALELDELSDEIGATAQKTEFNTKKLIDGSWQNSKLYVQVGANSGQGLEFNIKAMTDVSLGVTKEQIGAVVRDNYTAPAQAFKDEAMNIDTTEVKVSIAQKTAFETTLGIPDGGSSTKLLIDADGLVKTEDASKTLKTLSGKEIDGADGINIEDLVGEVIVDSSGGFWAVTKDDEGIVTIAKQTITTNGAAQDLKAGSGSTVTVTATGSDVSFTDNYTTLTADKDLFKADGTTKAKGENLSAGKYYYIDDDGKLFEFTVAGTPGSSGNTTVTANTASDDATKTEEVATINTIPGKANLTIGALSKQGVFTMDNDQGDASFEISASGVFQGTGVKADDGSDLDFTDPTTLAGKKLTTDKGTFDFKVDDTGAVSVSFEPKPVSGADVSGKVGGASPLPEITAQNGAKLELDGTKLKADSTVKTLDGTEITTGGTDLSKLVGKAFLDDNDVMWVVSKDASGNYSIDEVEYGATHTDTTSAIADGNSDDASGVTFTYSGSSFSASEKLYKADGTEIAAGTNLFNPSVFNSGSATLYGADGTKFEFTDNTSDVTVKSFEPATPTDPTMLTGSGIVAPNKELGAAMAEIGTEFVTKSGGGIIKVDENGAFSAEGEVIDTNGEKVDFTKIDSYKGKTIETELGDFVFNADGSKVEFFKKPGDGEPPRVAMDDLAKATDDEFQKQSQELIKNGESHGKVISLLMDKIDTSIEIVSAQRAQLGAYQNRLEHTIKNLDTSSENLSAAESRIRDTDMAKEMMSYTRSNVLQQAATSMLAQANQAPQNVLQLLR